MDKSKKKKIISNIIYVGSLVLVTLIALNFKVGVVIGDSMYPTLHDKQLVWIDKRQKEFDRFDIIVINTQDNYIIKRVIGLPGELVELKDGEIYIDGEILENPYKFYPLETYGMYPRVQLYDNSYYVLGDNINESADSRVYGPISTSNIMGLVRR
jgi:signal peptidase I